MNSIPSIAGDVRMPRREEMNRRDLTSGRW